MVATTLNLERNLETSILEDELRNTKMMIDVSIEPGIYICGFGMWLVVNELSAGVYQSLRYDLNYICRATRDKKLETKMLGEELQVVIEESKIPVNYLVTLGVATEKVDALVESGEMIIFRPYEGYNPEKDLLIPGKKYEVLKVITEPGNLKFTIKVGDETLDLGYAYFDLDDYKITRELQLKSKRVGLKRMLEVMYREF